jgi:hypothetical protein
MNQTTTVSEGPQNTATAPLENALSFLDGISEGAKTSSKEFPVVPDPDGSVAQMVALILKLADAEDQLKTSKKHLTDYAAEHYFNVCQGQAEPPSSMKAVGEPGAVLINFQQRMSKIKDTKQLAPLAPVFTARGKTDKDFFRLSFDLKIDGDAIPPAAVAALVTELKALFAKHGASAALKLDKEVKPYPAFYTQRHILFTPQENLAIHRLCPVVAVVRTKGVK